MSRTLFITGVSKGLGRALTLGFDALGHRILGCSRDQEALETLARDCSDRVSVQAVDVRDDAAVAAWIQSAVEEAGAPDLLINNAAIINPNAPLWHLDAETFDRVIDINIKGVQNVMRHALPHMIKQGRGIVINLSSGWVDPPARKWLPIAPPNGPSKA